MADAAAALSDSALPPIGMVILLRQAAIAPSLRPDAYNPSTLGG